MPQDKYSIKNLLNSNLKDHIPPEKKQGIFQINCKDCKKLYIGNTKRDLGTTVREHCRNVKHGELEKSALAAHIWKYAIDLKLVLLKQASNKQELKNWENILIKKTKIAL